MEIITIYTVEYTPSDEWLNTFILPVASPTTYDNYVRQIKNHIYPALGDVPVQNIKNTMIQKLYNDLAKKSTVSDKPLSAKTIKNIAMNLHAALNIVQASNIGYTFTNGKAYRVKGRSGDFLLFCKKYYPTLTLSQKI